MSDQTSDVDDNKDGQSSESLSKCAGPQLIAGNKREKRQARSRSLNTNVSVLSSLGAVWETSKALGELLANCFDASEDKSKCKQTLDKSTQKYMLINDVAPGRVPGLTEDSFSYSVNAADAKVDDRLKSGKFGYGLKDAVVILVARGYEYQARTRDAMYRARKDDKGDVHIDIDDTAGHGGDYVEQIVGWSKASDESWETFAKAVERAHEKHIFLRPEILAMEQFSVKNKHGIKIGTVYLPKKPVEVTELFLWNQSYEFVNDKRSRPPLFAYYNLHMDKAAVKNRDRASGLPDGWDTAVYNVVSGCKEVQLAILQARSNQEYYERQNGHIINMLTKLSAAEAQRKYEERSRFHKAADEKAAAEKELKRSEESVEEFERRIQDGRLEEDTSEMGTSPFLESLQGTLELRKSDTERARQRCKEATKEYDKAASKIKDEPMKQRVCVFKDRRAEGVVPDLDFPTQDEEAVLDVVLLDNPTKAGDTPMFQEYKRMLANTIPFSAQNIRCMRQLLRLLSTLGANDVTIRAAESASAMAVSAVDGSLVVNFTKSQDLDDIIVHAILSLSGMFPALRGLSSEQSLAHLAAVLLSQTPEDTRLLLAADRDVVKALNRGRKDASYGHSRRFGPLLVITGWDTANGGISSFNIQLAEGLAECLAREPERGKVYVLTTDLVSEENRAAVDAAWKEAEQKAIYVRDAAWYRGKPIPRLSSFECSEVSHIIGHAHITGDQALAISQLPQFSHAKLWQINHVLPRKVDVLKEEGTPQEREERARKKEAHIARLNKAAKRVFSVGPEMFQHYDQHDMRDRKADHSELVLPLHPDFLAKPTTMKSFSEVVTVLYFGRTDNVLFVKGVDIAVQACVKAAQELRQDNKRICLKLRGAAAKTEAETTERLNSWRSLSQGTRLDIEVEAYGTQDQIRNDLHGAGIMIMPSRVEPFGLVAMEAIAAGVPVIVSEASGVASLLRKHKARAFQIVPTFTFLGNDAVKADAEEWASSILAMVRSGNQAFEDAQSLKSQLMEKIKTPYPEMIKCGRDDILESS